MGFYTFIQGGFRGKVGDHIGQKQGGKYIQKAYVVPKNPQSPAQTAQRNKFKTANDFARISLYWFEKNALESYRKNDFLNERVKKYFEVREKIYDTLEPLMMPRYAQTEPSAKYIEGELLDEDTIQLRVLYRTENPTGTEPPPEFQMKIYCLFYNVQSATFFPYESEKLTSEEWSNTQEIDFAEDIKIGDVSEVMDVPVYVFLEIDGNRSDSFYDHFI